MSTVLKRCWQNDEIITTAFEAVRRERDDGWFSARLGVYLAMVETEFRQWLISPAGARGMFQLMQEPAATYGLRITSTVDERYEVDKAAPVAAKIMKSLAGEKEEPLRTLLMLARYLRGKDVRLPESDKFWQFVARTTYSYLSSTTQKPTGQRLEYKGVETQAFKYVQKLFAAAIVIENPEYFVSDLPRKAAGSGRLEKNAVRSIARLSATE